MKAAMKGKLLNKLKQIKPVGYLTQENRFLPANAAEAFLKTPILKAQAALFGKENSEKKPSRVSSSSGYADVVGTDDPEVIDVADLMKDLEDEEERESDGGFFVDDDKENVGPRNNRFEKSGNVVAFKEKPRSGNLGDGSGDRSTSPLAEIDVSSFRRPDLDSATLFDPNLLAAFEKAVKEHIWLNKDWIVPRVEAEYAETNPYELPPKSHHVEGNPLLAFEEKCPRGGSDSVIFYTTSLRGIRKTFEDCSSVRFLLDSFRVIYYERDISMHSGFKEELREILGGGAVLPPRLFIKGRYIGGAEEVLSLHERSKLRPLFEGIVKLDKTGRRCDRCAGMRFVLCSECSGSHRIVDDNGYSSKCGACNENGLIVCPMCS
ncbi:hypothetical protein MLD38_003784 [Melastoma candidum]|uniref:Uncharacterized protein n=1 Tax=Melastoma candidum TaxID=119954 RepID=A0ACB9S4D6_9MYRT|nr:hypothetical protein MLD38_003784 [Melastoma candidum]